MSRTVVYGTVSAFNCQDVARAGVAASVPSAAGLGPPSQSRTTSTTSFVELATVTSSTCSSDVPTASTQARNGVGAALAPGADHEHPDALGHRPMTAPPTSPPVTAASPSASERTQRRLVTLA